MSKSSNELYKLVYLGSVFFGPDLLTRGWAGRFKGNRHRTKLSKRGVAPLKLLIGLGIIGKCYNILAVIAVLKRVPCVSINTDFPF
jgi:hypothetical protein